MTCAERQDLLLLYALDADALDAARRDALRAHLAGGCPRCAGALAEARAVVGQVASAVTPVAPPPRAWETLMKRVGASGGTAGAGASSATQMKIDPRRAAVRSRWQPWLASGLAAAIAVAVTAGVFLYATRDSRSFWNSTNVTSLVLASQTQAGAVGQVLWDRDSAKWRVSVANLSPTVAGRVYELWFIPKGGKPIRSQTFTVDANRGASLVVPVPAGVGPLAIAAITDEPIGGSDAPTGQIHLSGAFQ